MHNKENRKAEGRNPEEIRNPNSDMSSDKNDRSGEGMWAGFHVRFSEFGLLSAFGLRISEFRRPFQN